MASCRPSTYTSQSPWRWGRSFDRPLSECIPLPGSGANTKGSSVHAAWLIVRHTNDKVNLVIAPTSRRFDCFRCVRDSLRDIKTMEVNHSFLDRGWAGLWPRDKWTRALCWSLPRFDHVRIVALRLFDMWLSYKYIYLFLYRSLFPPQFVLTSPNWG